MTVRYVIAMTFTLLLSSSPYGSPSSGLLRNVQFLSKSYRSYRPSLPPRWQYLATWHRELSFCPENAGQMRRYRLPFLPRTKALMRERRPTRRHKRWPLPLAGGGPKTEAALAHERRPIRKRKMRFLPSAGGGPKTEAALAHERRRTSE